MKNIIITGGGLTNKGAQAMTFIAVSELRKRYPNHQIYVLSTEDLKRPKEELEPYNFKFMGWFPLKFAKCQSKPILRFLYKLRNKEELFEAEKIYQNTDLMLDISGYALGSNWDDKICSDFLDNIEFAKYFGIPVVMMPQSFGPFDFAGRENVDARIKELLPYVTTICAREKEGYDQLRQHYNLDNVKLMSDLVLNNREINLGDIFKNAPALNIPNIEEGSIGIIPNGRTIVVGEKKKVINLYDIMINKLLQKGKKVYLLSHSTGDGKICEEIKNYFINEEKVVLLDKDYSCLEFNEIVKKFDFCIASRFHSIVHAFKNCTPCISLGWAIKYQELLSLFGQEQYVFDVRENIVQEDILAAIDTMDEKCLKESEVIEKCLELIQKENVFNILDGAIRR